MLIMKQISKLSEVGYQWFEKIQCSINGMIKNVQITRVLKVPALILRLLNNLFILSKQVSNKSSRKRRVRFDQVTK